MRRFAILLISLAGLISAGSLVARADEVADAAAIAHLMMATFDKPEAPLAVDPVTVQGDIAVAGWSQGEMGGRALLRRKHDKWSLALCSGDALKDAKSLQQFGLSAEDADKMAAGIAAAEARLDPNLVAKFSTFDGVVIMDGNGDHPQGEATSQDHKG